MKRFFFMCKLQFYLDILLLQTTWIMKTIIQRQFCEKIPRNRGCKKEKIIRVCEFTLQLLVWILSSSCSNYSVHRRNVAKIIACSQKFNHVAEIRFFNRINVHCFRWAFNRRIEKADFVAEHLIYGI